MKLKKLQEERADLLNQIETENNSETRSIEKIDELIAKLDEKEKEIQIEERLLNSKTFNKKTKEDNEEDFNTEIRAAIYSEKELDITNFEIEERAMGNPGVTGGNQSIGNISKTTFANAIIKKAVETSDLYKYVRKENFGSALHQIPVQKTKITEFANVKELAEYAEKNIDFEPIQMAAHKFGNISIISEHQIPVQKTKITEFANVKELAEYAEKNIDFEPIQMAAHKFGNISIISEEVLADTGYNIMGELLEQYGESAGLTIDKLLVKGDAATTLQGLNSFFNATGVAQSGAIKQSVKTANLADVGLDHIMAMYNGLPSKYREKATWVIGTELAARLTTATDGIGRPLLYQDFSQVPFGGQATPMLLGNPVVISDHVSNITGAAEHTPIAFFGDLSKALILGIRQSFTIKTSTEYKFISDGLAVKGITGAAEHTPIAFFGDLSKALILGIRQSFTIKTSTEYKFISDGLAVKGTMRLDIKRALGEALTALVVTAKLYYKNIYRIQVYK